MVYNTSEINPIIQLRIHPYCLYSLRGKKRRNLATSQTQGHKAIVVTQKKKKTRNGNTKVLMRDECSNTFILKSLFKDQVFLFKYYSTRRWYKWSHNRESWAQISNVYLIKEAIVDSIYIPNSCADSAISPLEVPPLPDSLVSRIWYNTLRYIWLCSIKQQANRNVSICKPRLSLAHEVTPSVILRKCISKSFSPLSWFPRSVSFSSLRYREGKSLILTLNIYISSYKKKNNGFLRCINKINWSLFFF